MASLSSSNGTGSLTGNVMGGETDMDDVDDDDDDDNVGEEEDTREE